MTDDRTAPEPELSYERARAELAAVVERLEAGAATLEESLALWERDGAQQRLDQAAGRRAAPGGRAPDTQD
jgi:exodeoxyribonuclease VII small subunit